jgi:hypothetical protein
MFAGPSQLAKPVDSRAFPFFSFFSFLFFALLFFALPCFALLCFSLSSRASEATRDLSLFRPRKITSPSERSLNI